MGGERRRVSARERGDVRATLAVTRRARAARLDRPARRPRPADLKRAREKKGAGPFAVFPGWLGSWGEGRTREI